MRRLALLSVAASTLAVAVAACGSRHGGRALPEGCQPLLDGRDCLLPYPSDFFRGSDGHLAVDTAAGPVTVSGESAVLGELADADGFSISSPIVTVWPAAASTDGLTRVIDDPTATTLASSPTVILEVPSGRLMPHFVDIDRRSDDPAQQAFVLRPVEPWAPATRYVVAIRHVQKAGGGVMPAPAAFAKIRDGKAAGDPALAAIAAHDESEVFPVLAAAGIARDDLQLAWDFTTDTTGAGSGPESDMLRVRALTLDWLTTHTPGVRVDSVLDHDAAHAWRTVSGAVTVPLFLTSSTDLNAVLARDSAGEVALAGTAEVPFLAVVGASVETSGVPGLAIGYGHGFFGSRDEVHGSSARTIADRLHATMLSIDWWGMSTPDALNIVGAIGSHPRTVFHFTDRVHQAMANWITVTAAMRGPLASQPAFQRPGGGDVYDPSRVDFLGISQGHILGGTLAGLDPDLRRVCLEVGGAGLMNVVFRAQPFQPFLDFTSHALPDPLDQEKFFAMAQTPMDRIDGATYAPYVLGGTLPGAPADRRVLMQMGIGDIEVPNHGTLFHARALGLPLLLPYPQQPYVGYGFTTKTAPFAGSSLAVYDFGVDPSVYLDPTPPDSNPVHEGVRLLPTAEDQMAAFFQGTASTITQPCDGVCDPN